MVRLFPWLIKMIKDCTAVILTGGESKRMGQDKASVCFRHQTLLEQSVSQLESLFDTVVISTRQQRSETALPQVLDDAILRAPIMGIVATLQYVRTHWVFVVGVDMPFVAADLVAFMATQRHAYDAVAIYADAMPQPLCCFYHQACLPKMQQHIKAGKRSLKQVLEAVNTHFISENEARLYDTPLRSLLSLDTTADIEQWSK